MNQPLKEVPLHALRVLLSAAEQAKSVAIADITSIRDEITCRLRGDAEKLFAASDKTSGDITFESADGSKFKASIGKTVSWDGKILQGIARGMEWEQAQNLFDIKFSIKEAKYAALFDPELKAKIDDARTVKYGDLSISPMEK